MNLESRVTLSKITLRPYQKTLINNWDRYNRLLVIWPRRAGKDLTVFLKCINECLVHSGLLVFYMLPTISQARKVIFNGVTNESIRFMDLIPREFIDNINSSEMKITFTNGSVFMLTGSDNYEALLGTNCKLMVFSEWALCNPLAFAYLKPIIVANGGKAVFISTPRGKNHLYTLYQVAQQNKDDWYCSKLTVEDTQHIPLELIQKEKDSGEVSEDLIQQEYYTSFDKGVEGSLYSKFIDRMRIEGRIGQVPYESSFPVYCAYDLGVANKFVIIFFQVLGTTVNVFDYYENTDQSLEHYTKILGQKPYSYAKHFLPHDAQVRDLSATGGITRLQRLQQLGLQGLSIVPSVPIEDGIEACKAALGSRIWIDEIKCAKLLHALESYRRIYDPVHDVYKETPLHDWSSDACDAFRMLCLSLPKTKKGTTPEELEERYLKTVYGQKSTLPAIFRNDTPKGMF